MKEGSNLAQCHCGATTAVAAAAVLVLVVLVAAQGSRPGGATVLRRAAMRARVCVRLFVLWHGGRNGANAAVRYWARSTQ